MEDKRNAYRILVGKLKGYISLRRYICKCEGDIVMEDGKT
jgi:hypothetical protein